MRFRHSCSITGRATSKGQLPDQPLPDSGVRRFEEVEAISKSYIRMSLRRWHRRTDAAAIELAVWFAPMTTSPSADERGSATRGALLDAARRCVRDGGLASATSRHITTEAGANLGAITYHFGSKDDLIAEALFGALEQRISPALEAFVDESPPTETLLSVVRQLLEEFQRNEREAPVYLEALLLATRDARYRERAVTLYGSLRTRLADLITDLAAQGVVPPWVEPTAMASLVLACANGIVLQSRLDPDHADPLALATQFAGLLVAAATSD